jgi:hypothetical protein
MKIISSKSTISVDEISKIEEQIKNKFKEIEYLKYEFSEISESADRKEKEWNKFKTKLENELEKFKILVKGNPKIEKITQDINITNWEDKAKKIKEEILTQKDQLEIDSHLFADYNFHSALQLEEELNRNLSIRNNLSKFSTEEKLKTVNVIACTLDGYIGRYTESKLKVDHIFLDEAGYANIIKTLTLFNHNVPITLLGDHMQLPPVCEINDSNIKNDPTYRNVFLWSQSSIHLDLLFKETRDFCLHHYLENYPFSPSVIKRTSLTSTYRFGQNLAAILAHHVYEKDFGSSNINGETQIYFINGKKIEPLGSRESSNEVNLIKNVVTEIKKNPNNDFIILTPYKKQIKLLNKSLHDERNNLKILTVHGSQGREWDTVILSVVDTSDCFFVDSSIEIGKKLLNTAISRAKKQLIIVCDKNYWLTPNGQLITDLIKNGKELIN